MLVNTYSICAAILVDVVPRFWQPALEDSDDRRRNQPQTYGQAEGQVHVAVDGVRAQVADEDANRPFDQRQRQKQEWGASIFGLGQKPVSTLIKGRVFRVNTRSRTFKTSSTCPADRSSKEAPRPDFAANDIAMH